MSCPSNGYDYREVSVTCGRTDYYGQQRFCGDCKANPADVENAAADNAWLKSAGWGEM